MIRFYYSAAPNPMKVALFLEEAQLAYEAIPVDTRQGDQFAPDFLKINPNGKVPAIVDGDVHVFDSNAILLYLADKTGRFQGQPQDKGQLLSWMMFIASGIGPFSGQSVHFRHWVENPDKYALNRYDFEAERHWKVLESHLEGRDWIVGDDYTVADMAAWGWARMVPYVLGNDQIWATLPNVKRLLDKVAARPAAQAAEALRTKHKFKTDTDAHTRRIMFPQIARLEDAAAG